MSTQACRLRKLAFTHRMATLTYCCHAGGLNFDCKVRRESSDLEDFFIAHIGGMDAFARGE
eukprot:COSAG01_NODE_9121_length_2545_cov_2.343418_7_plen_61_part_00